MKLARPVEVLPGASACATAYVASGCTCPRFYFGGFFPRKDAERKAALDALRTLDAALIFYESPNRVGIGARVDGPGVSLARGGGVPRAYQAARGSGARCPAALARRVRPTRARGFRQGEIAIVIDEPSAAEEDAAHLDAAEAACVRAAELNAEGARNKRNRQGDRC